MPKTETEVKKNKLKLNWNKIIKKLINKNINKIQ